MTETFVAHVNGFHACYRTQTGVDRAFIGCAHDTPREAIDHFDARPPTPTSRPVAEPAAARDSDADADEARPPTEALGAGLDEHSAPHLEGPQPAGTPVGGVRASRSGVHVRPLGVGLRTEAPDRASPSLPGGNSGRDPLLPADAAHPATTSMSGTSPLPTARVAAEPASTTALGCYPGRRTHVSPGPPPADPSLGLL